MRILLDENLARKLVDSLRAEGHQVESVHTLRMQGLDNGSLYRVACGSFSGTASQSSAYLSRSLLSVFLLLFA